MGKRGNRRGGRGGGRGSGVRGQGQRSTVRTDYSEVAKTNELFERYYNNLNLVEDGEKEVFWAALRKELPNSFRFTGSKGQALPVQQLLRDRYIPEITSIEHNGELVDPPNAIPWFPNQLAWQMTTPKNVVRRFPPFASFQKFLVSETSVGNISRQEVVSMIPPLLMDIRPGMTVLDMCAAPGSKAAQLLEMVHGGEEARMRKVIRNVRLHDEREVSPEGEALKQEMEDEKAGVGDWSDDGRATGLLIANDADYKRAHMLTHQMKRLNSPNLIVTNHDATMFPSIQLPSDPVPENVKPIGKYIKFDRILADVPCSGDGTCRKNVNVWKDWIPGNAMGLFSIQVRILVRALQMLKVGGRVVYSTCSMNPVENEAVVAAAIDRCGGMSKMDVIDCKEALPELKRKPGLSTWNVMDKQGRTWSSWDDIVEHKAKHVEDDLGRLTEAMFVPHVAQEKVPYHRCMRVYPHLQDTGAFFIAVLEKKTEIKTRPENEIKEDDTGEKREPNASIIDVVNELAAQPTNGTNPIEKVNSLDKIVAPHIKEETIDASAAARQNQAEEMLPKMEITAVKREYDAQADAEVATKRPKFREEINDAAPQGYEDRLEHWPPPPGAQLDISRPKTTIPDVSAYQSNKKKTNQPFEEPFKFLDPQHTELQSIVDFYGLSQQFPRDRFMVRNTAGIPTKTMYYTSELARSILTCNASSGIKFVHCGVKMFVKQDVQSAEVCRWRIQSEGMPVLEAWVGGQRVVKLWSRATLRKLLVEMFPKVNGDGWRMLGEIGERVRHIGMGCCILIVETGDGEDSFSERMVLPLWRSLHSLNLMLPKEDRKAMLLRLYNDDTPLQDHSKERFNKAPEASNDDTQVDDLETKVEEYPVADFVPKGAADEDNEESVRLDDIKMST